jgi:hypothetical protein
VNLQSFISCNLVVTAEAEGRRELTQHGAMSRLAEWVGRTACHDVLYRLPCLGLLSCELFLIDDAVTG